MKHKGEPIYLSGVFSFPNEEARTAIRETPLEAARFEDWDSERGPLECQTGSITFVQAIEHERKRNKNPITVTYDAQTLILRGAIHPGGYASTNPFAVFARVAATVGATGRLVILDPQTERGFEQVLVSGDAPFRRMSKRELDDALATRDFQEIAMWFANKHMPNSMEPASKYPSQQRHVPPDPRELGLRDYSQSVLGSGNRSESDQLLKAVPNEVLAAENAAREFLVTRSSQQLLNATRLLPQELLIYRKSRNGGEPIYAQDAFATGEEVRDALSAMPDTVHALWGRSLAGLSFALIADCDYDNAETLCRLTFFSRAPVHYRARAAWGLRKSTSNDILDEFINVIARGRNESLSSIVAAALGASVHPTAGPRVLDKLSTTLSELKGRESFQDRLDFFARALGRLHFEPALPILRKALRHPSGIRPEVAAEALVFLGNHEALEDVVELWQKDGDTIGAEALVSLGLDVALSRARATFSSNLSLDQDSYIRATSLLGVIISKVKKSDATRLEAIRNNDWFDAALQLTQTVVASEAVDLLAALRYPGTALAIVSRLESLDANEASNALVKLGDTTVLPHLKSKLETISKRQAKQLKKAVEILESLASPSTE